MPTKAGIQEVFPVRKICILCVEPRITAIRLAMIGSGNR
jgi:hypothetical protein